MESMRDVPEEETMLILWVFSIVCTILRSKGRKAMMTSDVIEREEHVITSVHN